MRRRFLVSLCVLSVVLSFAAGCDDASTEPVDSGASISDAGVTPTPGDNPGDAQSIVELAVANDSLTSLVAALSRPDMAAVLETLQGEGPFTVFAPTDSAFETFAAGGDLTDPSAFPADAVASVLQYHVVAGNVQSSDLATGVVPSVATNAAGNPIALFVNTADGVRINASTVTIADIPASNGVIHVIDTVLAPPTVVDMAGYAGLTSLVGAVGAYPELVGALSAAPDTSSDPNPGWLTVFAPVNDAFAGVTLPDNVAPILQAHVITGAAPVLSTGIPATADSLNGALTFETSTAGATVSGAGNTAPVNITATDIHVTNGVIHLIDGLILPSAG